MAEKRVRREDANKQQADAPEASDEVTAKVKKAFKPIVFDIDEPSPGFSPKTVTKATANKAGNIISTASNKADSSTEKKFTPRPILFDVDKSLAGSKTQPRKSVISTVTVVRPTKPDTVVSEVGDGPTVTSLSEKKDVSSTVKIEKKETLRKRPMVASVIKCPPDSSTDKPVTPAIRRSSGDGDKQHLRLQKESKLQEETSNTQTLSMYRRSR